MVGTAATASHLIPISTARVTIKGGSARASTGASGAAMPLQRLRHAQQASFDAMYSHRRKLTSAATIVSAAALAVTARRRAQQLILKPAPTPRRWDRQYKQRDVRLCPAEQHSNVIGGPE